MSECIHGHIYCGLCDEEGLQAKDLADAKAEGRREGIDAAGAAILEELGWADERAGRIVAALRALLPPAGPKDPSYPVDGGESGKVGG